MYSDFIVKCSKPTLNRALIPKTLYMWVKILITFLFQKGEAPVRKVSWMLRGLLDPELLPAPSVLGLEYPAVNPGLWACSLSVHAGREPGLCRVMSPLEKLISSHFPSPSPSNKVTSQRILTILVVVESHQPKIEPFLLKKSRGFTRQLLSAFIFSSSTFGI